MPTKQKKSIEFSELPILPVRDTVLFPHSILPLTVGRESSLKLINDLKDEDKFIAVVAQRDPRVDNRARAFSFSLKASRGSPSRKSSGSSPTCTRA